MGLVLGAITTATTTVKLGLKGNLFEKMNKADYILETS